MTPCIVSTLHIIQLSVWVHSAHTHYRKHLCGNGQYSLHNMHTHTCLIPSHCADRDCIHKHAGQPELFYLRCNLMFSNVWHTFVPGLDARRVASRVRCVAS
jgi:hypothetical protein